MDRSQGYPLLARLWRDPARASRSVRKSRASNAEADLKAEAELGVGSSERRLCSNSLRINQFPREGGPDPIIRNDLAQRVVASSGRADRRALQPASGRWDAAMRWLPAIRIEVSGWTGHKRRCSYPTVSSSTNNRKVWHFLDC